MTNKLQVRRLAWLALLLTAAFAGLGYRLVDLQVLRHEELEAKAEDRTQHTERLDPRRGDILDAKGNILATSVMVKTVFADPKFVGGYEVELARALASFLDMDPSKLTERLQPRVRTASDGLLRTNGYVVLKRKVPVETWTQIQNVLKNLNLGDETKMTKAQKVQVKCVRQNAIGASDDQLRVYPNQTLAAHVLGCVRDEEKEFNEKPVMEALGIDGIEQTFNSQLTGVRGWRLTERDNFKREMVTRREQEVEARDGANVVLTIDSVIQNISETALVDAMQKYSPISVSAIVARPRTGEILALATIPTYNPNDARSATTDDRRNRIITDLAEPGSTFKIVVVSGALNEHVVKLTDCFDCEHGHFYFAGRTLHDHESYGVLPVQDIIMKSSNIGAAKVGIKLGENRLYDYMKSFGFGEATGIPLPGEVSGRRYVPAVSNWTKVSIAQIPMGHGVSVSRIQMLMAMCAIANKGVLMRPKLVDRLEDADHKLLAQYPPQRVRQVITEATAKEMVQALKTVVTTNGTAEKAALDHYTVAGKTGTAQKVEGGTYVNKFFTSFIGFFPADNPEVCISITMDEPKGGHYGGKVAAPVFKQIAERVANYLSIPTEDGEPVPAPDKIAAPAPDNRPLKAARARTENN